MFATTVTELFSSLRPYSLCSILFLFLYLNFYLLLYLYLYLYYNVFVLRFWLVYVYDATTAATTAAITITILLLLQSCCHVLFPGVAKQHQHDSVYTQHTDNKSLLQDVVRNVFSTCDGKYSSAFVFTASLWTQIHSHCSRCARCSGLLLEGCSLLDAGCWLQIFCSLFTDISGDFIVRRALNLSCPFFYFIPVVWGEMGHRQNRILLVVVLYNEMIDDMV